MANVMEEGGCCVCSEATAEGENVIVYCDGPNCNLGTHKACYGIVDIPKDEWFCQKCIDESEGFKVVCELCPFRDGAFKRTNRGKWCHVICALYIPEATFQDTRRMESISLDFIPSERFQKSCYVCEDKGKGARREGAVISCSYTGCKFSFHVTCGHLEGLLVENVSRNSKIEYQGYCKIHIKAIKEGPTSGGRKWSARFVRCYKPPKRVATRHQPRSQKVAAVKSLRAARSAFKFRRVGAMQRCVSALKSVKHLQSDALMTTPTNRTQGFRPLARFNPKRRRRRSHCSSSSSSGSPDSPDKEGPPLLKPEVPAPGLNPPPPPLTAEQLTTKPPPIKKARKCSSSSSNGRGSNGPRKKSSAASGTSSNSFLQNILTSGHQGMAMARSASVLMPGESRSGRHLFAPALPPALDALELLGIGQPTPVAQHGLQTMEQLLEWQWNEGGQMLMQTAERGVSGNETIDTADIVSLLSCLHELKAQNERLQRQVIEMENKKGHLSHVTARLAETLQKFSGPGVGAPGTSAASAPALTPTSSHVVGPTQPPSSAPTSTPARIVVSSTPPVAVPAAPVSSSGQNLRPELTSPNISAAKINNMIQQCFPDEVFEIFA